MAAPVADTRVRPRWKRESPGEVAVLLSLIFLAKLAGATLPLVNQRGLLPAPRLWRGLFWCAAALLVTYGASNVIAALAALTGMIGTAQAMDTAALVGHAFLWDPLFLLWGLLLAAALKTSRPGHVSARADPRGPKVGDLRETEHSTGAPTKGR